MDYQRFIEQLPSLYENWGQVTIRPKSARFQPVLERVQGMTTANVMQLLNFAVDCLEPGELYCEVGCFQGSTLIGALLDHPEQVAYAVDNFSEFDVLNENLGRLTENLIAFDLDERVIFCSQDFEEFFADLWGIELDSKIGLYLYDGAHDYRSQLLGLLLVRPFLADQALIVIDDSNWDAVQQANWDFIAAHPQCRLLLDLPTPQNGDPSFWNGIQVLSWDVEANHHYDWAALQQVRQPSVVRAIYNLQFAGYSEKSLTELHAEALELHQEGRFVEAEQQYRKALSRDSGNADVWLNLGTLYYMTDQYQKSLNALQKSWQINASRAALHYNFGLVFEKLGESSQAVVAYQEAIALDPCQVDAYSNLGNILSEVGQSEQAEEIYRKAIAANPNHFGSYLNLGNVLMLQGQIESAIQAYQQALKLKPDHPDGLSNLELALETQQNPARACLHFARSFFKKKNHKEAVKQYQKSLEFQPGDADLYLALSDCFLWLNQEEEALNAIREGIRLYPEMSALHMRLSMTLQRFGRTQEAIAAAEESSRRLPDDPFLRFQKQRILPILYDTEDEICLYRQRFLQGLQQLNEELSLETPEARKQALEGASFTTNFYLQYQGFNDLEPQIQYGQLMHRLMACDHPDWLEHLPGPSPGEGGKIRVGYASAFFHNHTVAKLSLGWLRNANRQDFEIYGYHIGRGIDAITQQVRLHSDGFFHAPDDLRAACQQIVADQLHILVFLDIGMAPQATLMAGLRLAPVQCTTWAHPVTSGSPTVDYFLSSDLMEPDNAQAHYSEQLIRLPNLGFSYAKPEIPQPTKTRSDFQLRDDAVVYLSCQSLFKYLPQYDFVLAEIARRVPQAQFVFISRLGTHLTQQFQQRLQRAFAAVDLDSEDYCVALPNQGHETYLDLNLVSDIFLDTFSWSGGNTTLEAIACNLPVVTCPGEFMRGRHSYAILKMLGVTDTIAKDEAEYIEIAVRLGLDQAWRRKISQRIASRHDRLYDDRVCVEALEAFYRQVVHSRQS